MMSSNGDNHKTIQNKETYDDPPEVAANDFLDVCLCLGKKIVSRVSQEFDLKKGCDSVLAPSGRIVNILDQWDMHRDSLAKLSMIVIHNAS